MTHHTDRENWDRDYSARGHVWGGSVHALPPLPQKTRVLELGCGNGKTLAGMLQCGWRVVATDFSHAATCLTKKTIPGSSSCEVVVSDVRFLPFCSRSFDAVFAWHILGHLPKKDRISSVHEITRLLGPGGYLFFSEFSQNDFRFGNGTLTEQNTFMRGNGIRTHYFTDDEVRDIFCNFEEKSVSTRTWTMRIRGKDLVRSEIQAVFVTRDA
ncbi:MAG: class I SAM-dependent methyltransferase [Methanoregula sp.]